MLSKEKLNEKGGKKGDPNCVGKEREEDSNPQPGGTEKGS